jgi:iron(III) transport system substrate-binding protein
VSYLFFSRRKFLNTVASATIGTVFLKGCQKSSTQQTEDENQTTDSGNKAEQKFSAAEQSLYEAAQKEGKLVWYCVYFDQEIVDEIGQAFTQKYPGIEFEGARNTATNLFQKLSIEAQSNLNIADVYATTDFSQMLQLKQEQKLQQYQPTGIENVIEKYRGLDPENYYQLGATLPIIIGYNSELIPQAETPTTWQELINQKYQDKIATGSAASSGQVGTWALSMEQKYGWDYILKFNQLNPQLSRSINDVVPALVSKERAIGATTVGQVLTRKSLGDPLDVIYPEDGTVVVVSPIGILQKAPHPNAAKLFLNFINSKEYSQVLTKYFEEPLNQQVKLPGSKPLAQVKTYTPKPEEIKQNIPAVKEKWSQEFGA